MEATKGVLPLYYRVASTLRAKIERGEYEENLFLPSEQELCKKFGVSRITVRQATALLRREGLIYSRAGYGTVIRTRRNGIKPDARVVGSFRDLLEFRSSTEVQPISKEVVPAPDFVAEKLHCNKGDEVFFFRCLRSMSELSEIAYTETYVPYHMGLNISLEMIESQPIFSLIQDLYGVRITDAEQILTAVAADKRLAAVLKIKRNTPLLRIMRTFLTEEGEPVDLGVAYYNTAKIQPIIHLGQVD